MAVPDQGGDMDQTVKRGFVVLFLLLGPVVIGAVLAVPGNNQQQPRFSDIGTVLEEDPVGEQVMVVGTVVTTPDDYTADSGNTYQQFTISDESGEIRVFCSTAEGRVRAAPDDRVRVTGTFKEFHGTREITTACAAIE